jgi:hypothetical protein
VRIRVSFYLAIILAMLACSGKAWDVKGAPSTPPDEQFRTGVEVGYDAYVWHCYMGERIVVTQRSSACFGTSKPVLHKGPCGAPLAAESSFPAADGGGRDDIPGSYRWPGSPP